jgi:hypothetical protein
MRDGDHKKMRLAEATLLDGHVNLGEPGCTKDSQRSKGPMNGAAVAIQTGMKRPIAEAALRRVILLQHAA